MRWIPNELTSWNRVITEKLLVHFLL